MPYPYLENASELHFDLPHTARGKFLQVDIVSSPSIAFCQRQGLLEEDRLLGNVAPNQRRFR